jgi:hypothetical protein
MILRSSTEFFVLGWCFRLLISKEAGANALRPNAIIIHQSYVVLKFIAQSGPTFKHVSILDSEDLFFTALNRNHLSLVLRGGIKKDEIQTHFFMTLRCSNDIMQINLVKSVLKLI